MPSSPIRKLAPFADAAKKEGVQVYHLNIGQPDIATPSVMLEAVQQANLKVLEYTDSRGILSLRKKLATYYNSKGIDVDYEDVLITIGGSEAILFAFMACLDEGDEIIVPEPFYANYIGFAMAAGIHIIPITSKIDNGFALPPIASFQEKITPKTKGIFICNPNNPTGALYSDELLKGIVDLAREHGLIIFADEVYDKVLYDDVHHTALGSLSKDVLTLTFNSLSKSYRSCGYRAGWMIVSGDKKPAKDYI